VTIKLFDVRPASVVPASKNGFGMAFAVGAGPQEQDKPWADSDAGFDVVESMRSARRLNDYGPAPVPDPRPAKVGQSEGTMQLTPVGFESRWDADGAALPFTLTKK